MLKRQMYAFVSAPNISTSDLHDYDNGWSPPVVLKTTVFLGIQ